MTARNATIFRSLATLMCLLSPTAVALAAPLTNTKLSVSPKTVNTGQSIVLETALRATSAISNASVTFEIRRVSDAGRVNSYALYSKTVPGQTFAAGETKNYRESYPVPKSLISSNYALVVTVTNADKSEVYLEAKSADAPQTFTVKGRPDIGYVRGINIMDMGISSQNLPGIYGTHYTKPSLLSLQSLKGRGLEMVRIPFKWERIQPVLGGELNAAYLDLLMQVLRDSNTAGLKVMLDMHNFGRYTPTSTPERTAYALGDPRGATPAHFADVWRRIALAVRADENAYKALYAYDLMNEPYDLVAGAPTGYKKAVISSFANTVDGWAPHWVTTTSVARGTRTNRPTLEVTGNPIAGNGMVFRIALPSTIKPLSKANGGNIQFKGFVPDSTSGDVKTRIWMLDGNSIPTSSPVTTITKGEEFTIDFAPSDAVWNNNKGIYIDFMVDNSNGFAPSVFYVDEVNQGIYSGGKAPQRVWEEYSQAAVTAIRAINDATPIHVEGYHFSSAALWPVNHPTAWIKDPLNKIVYHSHQYMDDDSSGAYKLSHARELALAKKQGHASVGARAIARYKKFTDWLVEHNVEGYMGEIGWPNSAMVGEADATEWNKDGELLFDFMDTMNLGAAVWATGSWLPATGNILNTYELPESNRKFQPLSQAAVLEAHPGNKK
jgi:hypothetical protein